MKIQVARASEVPFDLADELLPEASHEGSEPLR
jgi:hypothetical protein